MRNQLRPLWWPIKNPQAQINQQKTLLRCICSPKANSRSREKLPLVKRQTARLFWLRQKTTSPIPSRRYLWKSNRLFTHLCLRGFDGQLFFARNLPRKRLQNRTNEIEINTRTIPTHDPARVKCFCFAGGCRGGGDCNPTKRRRVFPWLMASSRHREQSHGFKRKSSSFSRLWANTQYFFNYKTHYSR